MELKWYGGLLVTFITKLVLPSIDVYLDMYLVYQAYKSGNPWWASLILFPVILNFGFTYVAWWNHEKPNAKLWSWTFLVLQLWPQSKVVMLMMKLYADKDKKKYKKKLKAFGRTIGSIEPGLEAGPQALIKWAIFNMGTSTTDLFGSNLNFVFFMMFVAMFTGIYSLGDAILSGPCHINSRKESGKRVKFLLWAFIFLGCSFTIQSKACLMSFYMMLGTSGSEAALRAIMSFVTLFGVPMVVSIIPVCSVFGLWDTLKVYFKFPSILFIPAYTFITYGPVAHERGGGCLMISRKWTLVNFFANLVGTACFVGLGSWRKGVYDWDWGIWGTSLLFAGFGYLLCLGPRKWNGFLSLGVLQAADLSTQFIFDQETGEVRVEEHQ